MMMDPFRTAASSVTNHLKVQIKFEYLGLTLCRENELPISQVVDWLLSSHFHFILCHVHQHTEGLGWSVEDIYSELSRLKYHNGFPNLEKLSCPIFVQDKKRYLEALPPSYTMPTLQIPLSRDMDMVAAMDSARG